MSYPPRRGETDRVWIAVFILCLLLGVAMIVIAALLSPLPAHSEDRGAWFKNLKQPVTGASCCDIADCRPADAEWRGGQWWADVQGEMTPIPREKELAKKSLDGQAYVCSGYDRRIYCFVPPSPES